MAILANGGHMPALPAAMRAAGLTYTGVQNNSVAEATPRLAWLVDRFAAPHWLPIANIYSLGDMLIVARRDRTGRGGHGRARAVLRSLHPRRARPAAVPGEPG